MKPWWRWFLYIGILGAAVFPERASLIAQDLDPQVEKVFSDWKKRQGLAKCVLYQVRGERIEPKGSWRDSMGIARGKLPVKDIVSTSRRSYLLDFPTNRYRQVLEEELYDSGTDKLYPYVQTRTYDGTLIRSYQPRERNSHPNHGIGPTDPEIEIGKGEVTKVGVLSSLDWPLFFGHGSIPSAHRPARVGLLTVLPDPELFYVHGPGVHQGRPCLVLRTHSRQRSYEEFWVDPSRDNALVRQTWSLEDKKPYKDLEVEYDNPVHRWLPSRWTYTERDIDTQIIRLVERMRVEMVTLDPPVNDSDFQIEERPGMLVSHVTFEPSTTPGTPPVVDSKPQIYRAEGGGKLQEVIVKDGVVQEVHSNRWLWWLLTLLPAVGLVIWLLRWRKAARGSPTG